MGLSLGSVDMGLAVLVALTIVAFVVPALILFPPVPASAAEALSQTHSRLGLAPAASNLSARPRSAAGPLIQSLFIYPIKSCGGIELSRAKVLPHGLQYDRLYLFARLKPKPRRSGPEPDLEWEFITMRQFPRLANVKVDLWLPDAAKSSPELEKTNQPFLLVRFPWTDPGLRGLAQRAAAKLRRGWSAVPVKEFILPFDFPSPEEIKARGYEYVQVRVWKDSPLAINMESELPPELASYLGLEHRLGLFRVDPSQLRPVIESPPSEDVLAYSPVINFQDGHPLHMLGLSSVQALGSIIQDNGEISPLNIRRFRPNVIISGSEPYEEDGWKEVRCSRTDDRHPLDSKFAVSCLTSRCKMPNVDPDTGLRHKVEPDRTLRKQRAVDKEMPGTGCLGIQLCPIFKSAEGEADQFESYLEVGMEVHGT